VLLNPLELRRAATLGALAMILRLQANVDRTFYSDGSGQVIYNTAGGFRRHADYYDAQYAKALRRITARVDTNGDGRVDRLVSPGQIALKRE